MRPTIGDLLEFVNACPPARRWAKKLGKRAFKRAWTSGLRPTVHDRNIHMIEKSIHSWWQHNGYGRVVPGRVVRSVVSWECFRDLLEQVDDMLRRQL